jgi:hypothetical protein
LTAAGQRNNNKENLVALLDGTGGASFIPTLVFDHSYSLSTRLTSAIGTLNMRDAMLAICLNDPSSWWVSNKFRLRNLASRCSSLLGIIENPKVFSIQRK